MKHIRFNNRNKIAILIVFKWILFWPVPFCYSIKAETLISQAETVGNKCMESRIAFKSEKKRYLGHLSF